MPEGRYDGIQVADNRIDLTILASSYRSLVPGLGSDFPAFVGCTRASPRLVFTTQLTLKPPAKDFLLPLEKLR